MQVAFYLDEFLEYLLSVVRSYSDASILDLECNDVFAFQVSCNTDMAAASELQRVRDQVAKNLGEFAFVGIQRCQARVCVEDQFKAVAREQGLEHAPQGAEKVMDLKVPGLDLGLARLHFCQVEQVVDKFGELSRRSLDVDDLFLLLLR